MGLISRVSSRTYRYFSKSMDDGTVDSFDKLSDSKRKENVRKTVIGIMNSLKTGAPLDFSTFKAMHKDTPIYNIIHNKSKTEDETPFEEYMKEVDEPLQLLEL